MIRSTCMIEDVSNNEILEFLQEHMVTRGEFKEEVSRLDGKINQTKLDLIDAMDEKLGDLNWVLSMEPFPRV